MLKQPDERYYRDGDGRWRSYRCRRCGAWFDAFLGRPLPQDARYCDVCRQNPDIQKKVATAFDRRRLEEDARTR